MEQSSERKAESRSSQILFIRHGERADKHPERQVFIEEMVDAPLTPIGIIQA